MRREDITRHCSSKILRTFSYAAGYAPDEPGARLVQVVARSKTRWKGEGGHATPLSTSSQETSSPSQRMILRPPPTPPDTCVPMHVRINADALVLPPSHVHHQICHLRPHSREVKQPWLLAARSTRAVSNTKDIREDNHARGGGRGGTERAQGRANVGYLETSPLCYSCSGNLLETDLVSRHYGTPFYGTEIKTSPSRGANRL